MEAADSGRVILLNGPSSSGKSSIAVALQAVLPQPWFHFPIDALGAMRSVEATAALDDDGVASVLRRTRMGYHRAVAGIASAGNNVIMDYPLSEPWRLQDLLRVLDGYDITLVHVHCDPAVLEAREHARGDRPLGLARSQDVLAHGDCDIAIDTSNASAEECARSIAAEWAARTHPRAFDRLRMAR